MVELKVESIYTLIPLKMTQFELALKYTFRNNGCNHQESLHGTPAVKSQAEIVTMTYIMSIDHTFTLSPNHLHAQCVNVEPLNVSFWFQTLELWNRKPFWCVEGSSLCCRRYYIELFGPFQSLCSYWNDQKPISSDQQDPQIFKVHKVTAAYTACLPAGCIMLLRI